MNYLFAIGILPYLINSILSSSILDKRILPSHHDRIYGGENAKPNQYPFTVVALVIPAFELFGGVIISNNYILTTAQYIHNSENIVAMVIYVGAHQFSDPDEDGRQDDIIRSDDLPNCIAIHEDFNPETLANNIALIKLTKRLHFSDTVQSIKLPPPTLTALSLVDKTATLIGWGYSEESPEEYEVFPKHVNVTVMHQTVCNHYYATENKSMALCTDGEFRKGACQGDVGSPLITTLEDDDSVVLLGIVSFLPSVGCKVQWPTTYTSTIAYLDWIQENMLES